MRRCSLISRARRTTTVVLYGSLVLSVLPAPAFAARIISSDGVTISVSSFMVGSRFTPPIDEPRPKQVAYGAPVEVKADVSTKTVEKFLPFEGSQFQGVTAAFAKANLNANGTGGVGISGIHETRKVEDRDDARMEAKATFTTTLRNIGDSGGPVNFTFTIPRLELAVYPETNPGDATSPFVAQIYGVLVVKHFTAPALDIPDDTGTLIREFALFDYSISFDQANPDRLLVSADLLADAGPVRVPDPDICDLRSCLGLRFDPFEVTKTVVDDFLPGERLEYVYAMVATTNYFGTLGLDGQAGAAAFYGDPFEIGGGSSSFVIHDFAPAPVPLPGTWGLLLPGLLWLQRRAMKR
jgi:hypothetical protein